MKKLEQGGVSPRKTRARFTPAKQLLEEKEMAIHSSVLAWRISGTREPWWAAVYGVAQSRTRLKRLSSSSSSKQLLEKIRTHSPFTGRQQLPSAWINTNYHHLNKLLELTTDVGRPPVSRRTLHPLLELSLSGFSHTLSHLILPGNL